ncbi:MAG: hypothetical protein ACP5C4_04805 [Methanomicrobiales archaeon]
MNGEGILLVVFGVAIFLCLGLTAIMLARVSSLSKTASSLSERVDSGGAEVRGIIHHVHEIRGGDEIPPNPALRGEH